MLSLSNEDLTFVRENIHFWNDLTDLQKQLVQSSINLHDIPKGVQLVRSSTECRGMILIKKGRVRAFLSSEDGREVTLYRLLPGDSCIMTASCMIPNVRFQVYLEAEQDLRMYVIPQTVFIRLNSENSSVKDYTMNALADKFSETVSLIDKMVFSSVPSRIAHFLLEMSHIDDSNIIETTHDIIAKNIGSAREVVSRVLKGLEKDGLVSLKRGKIILKDIRGLFELTDT